MRIRRIVAAALVATLALGAVACSGDDEAEEDGTTTTEAADETTTTVAELSDEDYVAAVEPIMTALDGAGTDLCKVLEVAYGSGPQAPPSTVEQVKVTVAAQAKILRSLAATEPVEAASAPVLTATADKLEADAEAAGYSLEFFETGVNAVFDTDEFRNAITPYQNRQAAECVPADTTTDGSATDGADTSTTIGG